MKRTIQPLLSNVRNWLLNSQLILKLILFTPLLLTQDDVIAQCNNLTCKPNPVPVYLAQNCSAVVDPNSVILIPPSDCPGGKIAMVFNAANINIGNIVGPTQIGQTLKVIITDLASNKTCEGKIIVKDTIAPTVVCQSDITVNCNVSIAPANLPSPIVFDNCAGSFSLTNTDVVVNNPCPTPDMVFRTWKATDASGNSKTCTTKITLKRPLLSDVKFILATNFILPCGVNPENLQVLGQPTIDGNPIGFSSFCDFVAVKSDSTAPAVLPLTGVTYFRKWVVTDVCLGISTSATQVFTVNDVIDPTITCPPDVTFQATENFCPDPITLVNPIVTDNCLTNPVIVVSWPLGDTIGSYSDVPSGVYNITYSVTDYGLNTAFCTFKLTVVDNIEPVAVCKGKVVIALSNNTPSILMPSSVDNGSYDNCNIVSYELDRLDDPAGFQPSLSFDCDDVGDTIDIHLKVSDPSGLFAVCESQVIVQDKIAPFIICPLSTTADCAIDFGDFTQFGDITISEPCLDTVLINIVNNINNCSVGNYQRVFTVLDVAGNSAVCTQTITVVNNHPFDGAVISWPPDTTSSACIGPDNFDPEDFPPPFDAPIIPDTDPCALIAINHEDHLFTVAQPSCYKIMRIWKVIDWCQYDPITGAGSWTHTQIIKIQDTIAPVLVCPPVINGSVGMDCKTGNVLMVPVTAIDCNPKVKITNDSKYSIKKDGDASGVYPVGTTKVTFTANDACGNFSTCSVLVVVKDDKKPTPKCLFGLATDMVSMGGPDIMSIVDAKAFNASSIDNCTPSNKLIFSYSPDTSDTQKIFTCDDLGINDIQVWVTDANGNQDYCITFIDVQNNMFPCQVQLNDTIYVSGSITTESNEKLENVNVQLSGAVSKDLITKKDGAFMFSPLPMGKEVEVLPGKSDAALNGISTIDILKIQQHILGNLPLSSPYKIIAADVDGSKKISIGDIVLLKKLILHQITEFPGQPVWKFIDKNYKFPNPANPWQEEIPIKFFDDHLMANKTGVDFLGIKLGDINNTVILNAAGANEVRGINQVLPIVYEDKSFTAGEYIDLPLLIGNSIKLNGLQFTISINPDLVDVSELIASPSGGLGKDDIYYDPSTEKLHISWSNINAADFNEKSQLLNLRLKALKASRISEVISITNVDNYPEAITDGNELRTPILLPQDGSSKQLQFTLFQNKPNPFNGSTQISFFLTEATEAKLKIMDMTGQVVYETIQNYNPGLQEINIEASQLSGPGVYIYSVESDKHNATGRMILLQ